jgi:hypothetical protein
MGSLYFYKHIKTYRFLEIKLNLYYENSIDIPVEKLIYTHQKSLETSDILRCIN